MQASQAVADLLLISLNLTKNRPCFETQSFRQITNWRQLERDPDHRFVAKQSAQGGGGIR